jgi:hypothetical protein
MVAHTVHSTQQGDEEDQVCQDTQWGFIHKGRKKSQAQWCITVIPATLEAEVGVSQLEPVQAELGDTIWKKETK